MFNFTVKHGHNGATTAWLDVDSGPDQMTYCASFDLYDWFAPLHFSVETMIYNPDNPEPDVGDDGLPSGYAYTSHTQNVCWF